MATPAELFFLGLATGFWYVGLAVGEKEEGERVMGRGWGLLWAMYETFTWVSILLSAARGDK